MRPPPGTRRRVPNAVPHGERAMLDPAVRDVVERASAPVRVALCGRAGAGRRTLAAVLGRIGITVAGSVGPVSGESGGAAPGRGEVVCRVVVEAVKPEDIDAVAAARASGEPVVVAWNKADVADCAAGVPTVSRRLGAPVEPVSGLLGATVLDGRIDGRAWAALGRLTVGERPGHLIGILGPAMVERAAQRVRSGCSRGELDAALWTASGIGALVARLTVAVAQVRYRRLRDATGELEALAVGDRRVRHALGKSGMFARRAAAAEDLARAVGVAAALRGPGGRGGGAPGRPRTGPQAALQAARHWQQLSRAPVSALHRDWANDMASVALRHWADAAAGSRDGRWGR